MGIERNDKGFRKLLVWQRAHELVLSIYKITEKFPKGEIFALTSQLRRAAVDFTKGSCSPRASFGLGRRVF
ncbi:MAG: four helix bundle protein [Chloroflexi bacterium CFX2]|nr:four helix bundle protein [Chloroflexi bacterium CFX2]